jgi:hypothetical protein
MKFANLNLIKYSLVAFLLIAVAFLSTKLVSAESLEQIQAAIEKARVENLEYQRIHKEKENKQVLKQQAEVEREKRVNTIRYTIGGIIVFGFMVYGLTSYLNPASVEERRLRNEQAKKDREKERFAREEAERVAKENRVREALMIREASMMRYKQLRKEIEAMPQYEHWRQAVIEKFGRKCVVCGSTKNIEIDHRYKSFYDIVRSHGIINTIQAYECAALWDVNNGAPLCKAHHNETASSIYRQKKYDQIH